MADPTEHPGAVVKTGILRPKSHDPAEYAQGLAELVAELSPGSGYFVKHLAQSTPVKNGWAKGLRYPIKLVFWPLPTKR